MTTGNQAHASRLRLYPLILCALFAALTVAGAIIQIPLPFTPVPISLATLAVYLAGGLLGAKYGALSQVVYILLGGVGLPVFSNFQGGIGVIAGPTGGYIIGYVAAALIVGLIAGNGRRPPARKLTVAMISGTAACYALGTAWFMISTGTSLSAALSLCVVPFLIGDILKILAAILLIKTLKRYLVSAAILHPTIHRGDHS
jgi:biotin transport system substrate-specific component